MNRNYRCLMSADHLIPINPKFDKHSFVKPTIEQAFITQVPVLERCKQLLMTFIGRKLRHAANAPSQPLHDYSYPRTGTFSVVS